jgi:hypothetical protein
MIHSSSSGKDSNIQVVLANVGTIDTRKLGRHNPQ